MSRTRRGAVGPARARKLLGGLLATPALLIAGCGGGASPSTEGTAPGRSSDAALDGAITVSAARSLSDAFTELGEDFAAANPGVEVTFNFDASSILATQILEGAPVDVFAPADESDMARLTGEDLVAGSPATFARNALVIITQPGNPLGIETLADLAEAGVISLCAEEVPCGRYAAEALAKAGVTIDESRVTRGQNAGATLAAVAQGDAAAGVAYVTDARAAGDAVEAVAIPAEHNVIAAYPIGLLRASGDAEVAEAFIAYVMSEEGQAVLEAHGFVRVG